MSTQWCQNNFGITLNTLKKKQMAMTLQNKIKLETLVRANNKVMECVDLKL